MLSALGAGVVLSKIAGKGPVAFLVVLVAIYRLIAFGVGWLPKMEIETLSAASQACVGCPSTACSLVKYKRWMVLMTPAVLVEVLGYAIGNYAGNDASAPGDNWVAGRVRVSYPVW